jgi:hypothetical protein
MTRNRAGIIRSCLAALAAATLLSGAARASGGMRRAQPPIWAAWISRDIDLHLKNLPQVYSCDALWYKLRGVLLAIGARKYMSITPYSCGRAASLHVRFQTLHVLTGADIRWANTKATYKAVRLAPGDPAKLDAGDCALLSQLAGSLFVYLDLPVVSQHLECSDPRAARRFYLSVRALLPRPSGATHS